jgi:hypothetical protein
MQNHEHNQNHVISVQSHKREDCAFARVLQNMQDNKLVLPAEHAES